MLCIYLFAIYGQFLTQKVYKGFLELQELGLHVFGLSFSCCFKALLHWCILRKMILPILQQSLKC